MKWTEKKAFLLKSLSEHIAERRVDSLAVPFIERINSFAKYATSSSCSGRVILLEMKHSKKDARIIRSWHEEWTVNELSSEAENYSGKKDLWLFAQGFIFHVYCYDLSASIALLDFCRRNGLKRSGIISISRFPVVEIISTNYLAVPLIVNEKPLFAQDKLIELEMLALAKLKLNIRQLKKLTSTLTELTDILKKSDSLLWTKKN